MVYNGPSTGCMTCRKRKVKCSQERPACNNCLKRKQVCPGYNNTFDARHRNQTQSIIKKAGTGSNDVRQKIQPSNEISTLDTINGSTTSEISLPVVSQKESIAQSDSDVDGSTPRLLFNLPMDVETLAINFFNANYGTPTGDVQATHGFFIDLTPIYHTLSSDSPLKAATLSIAANLFMLFARQGSDTTYARKQYVTAVKRLKDRIAEPEKHGYEESLTTVLTLDFYDSLNSKFYPERDPGDAHKTGALALIMHQGQAILANEKSRQTAVHVRTVINHWAIDHEQDLPPEALQLLGHPSLNVTRADHLDALTLTLIELRTRFKNLYTDTIRWSMVADDSEWQFLMDDAKRLETEMYSWRDNIPMSWKPVYVSAEEIQPTIKAAGFYGNRCSVYKDLEVCHITNVWRFRTMILSQIIQYCHTQCAGQEDVAEIYAYGGKIAEITTDMCESVPYQIGDADLIQIPDYNSPICYPYVSSDEGVFPDPKSDHPRQALASGGWIIYGLLGRVLGMTEPSESRPVLQLPHEQKQWMLKQLKRIECVYMFVNPT